MSLVWRDQLSVGNDVIDADHKHLIEIINRAEHSLNTKNRNELMTTLDALSGYSKVHFDREERIAAAAGYSQTPGLHQSHESLLAGFEHVRGEIDAMRQDWSAEAAEHFSALLRNWLLDHVIKEDLLMKPVLQKHSPSFDPR